MSAAQCSFFGRGFYPIALAVPFVRGEGERQQARDNVIEPVALTPDGVKRTERVE
jgi:hypothetical protein